MPKTKTSFAAKWKWEVLEFLYYYQRAFNRCALDVEVYARLRLSYTAYRDAIRALDGWYIDRRGNGDYDVLWLK